MKRLRALAAIAGIGIGTIGVTGATASADAPLEFPDSVTFTDVNPCTNTPMEVTINFDVRLHLHGDRIVVRDSRTGSTDDGYVMEHGRSSTVINGNIFRQANTDNWRNDDGSKFQARTVFVAAEDGVRVDRFTLRCLDR